MLNNQHNNLNTLLKEIDYAENFDKLTSNVTIIQYDKYHKNQANYCIRKIIKKIQSKFKLKQQENLKKMTKNLQSKIVIIDFTSKTLECLTEEITAHHTLFPIAIITLALSLNQYIKQTYPTEYTENIEKKHYLKKKTNPIINHYHEDKTLQKIGTIISLLRETQKYSSCYFIIKNHCVEKLTNNTLNKLLAVRNVLLGKSRNQYDYLLRNGNIIHYPLIPNYINKLLPEFFLLDFSLKKKEEVNKLFTEIDLIKHFCELKNNIAIIQYDKEYTKKTADLYAEKIKHKIINKYELEEIDTKELNGSLEKFKKLTYKQSKIAIIDVTPGILSQTLHWKKKHSISGLTLSEISIISKKIKTIAPEYSDSRLYKTISGKAAKLLLLLNCLSSNKKSYYILKIPFEKKFPKSFFKNLLKLKETKEYGPDFSLLNIKKDRSKILSSKDLQERIKFILNIDHEHLFGENKKTIQLLNKKLEINNTLSQLL